MRQNRQFRALAHTATEREMRREWQHTTLTRSRENGRIGRHALARIVKIGKIGNCAEA